eukprot:scaffold1239_cov175-Pinguiococcus_pyrenoidosus.AAC.5
MSPPTLPCAQIARPGLGGNRAEADRGPTPCGAAPPRRPRGAYRPRLSGACGASVVHHMPRAAAPARAPWRAGSLKRTCPLLRWIACPGRRPTADSRRHRETRRRGTRGPQLFHWPESPPAATGCSAGPDGWWARPKEGAAHSSDAAPPPSRRARRILATRRPAAWSRSPQFPSPARPSPPPSADATSPCPPRPLHFPRPPPAPKPLPRSSRAALLPSNRPVATGVAIAVRPAPPRARSRPSDGQDSAAPIVRRHSCGNKVRPMTCPAPAPLGPLPRREAEWTCHSHWGPPRPRAAHPTATPSHPPAAQTSPRTATSWTAAEGEASTAAEVHGVWVGKSNLILSSSFDAFVSFPVVDAHFRRLLQERVRRDYVRRSLQTPDTLPWRARPENAGCAGTPDPPE